MDTSEPRTEKTLDSVESISTLAEHHDPLRDIGDWPRVLCGWVIAVCAVLCALLAVFCAIAIVVLALRRDWQIVGSLAVTALMCGLFIAAPLFWLARRLLRGKRTANGATVLPHWLIRVMGVVVIAGSPVCAYLSAFDPKFPIKPPLLWEVIVGGPVVGIGMIIAPWLAKRRIRQGIEQPNAGAETE